jgi:hypothetical protein
MFKKVLENMFFSQTFTTFAKLKMEEKTLK